MIRRIIEIDKEKCNGCGLCANACHEGAIGMVDGKATLLRDDYCDGLGDCLPVCPTGAITFVDGKRRLMTKRLYRQIWRKKAKHPALAPAARANCWKCRKKWQQKQKRKQLLYLRCLPDCVSGLCRSNWHPSKPLTLMARNCSLRQTVPHMLMAISMRNS